MLRSKSTQPITQAVGRCAFCGTRLAAAPKRMASHRAFSSQSAAIAAPAFSGWQMPRWQLSRRTQRARYSSVLNAIQTPHPTPSSASLILQNARPRSRTYATIIEVPTATEDDLPEPVLQRGEESESTTISVTPAAEKQLARIQAKEKDPNLALRILVESGGCHGYSTKLQVADAVKDRQEDDYILAAKSTPSSSSSGLLLVDAVTLNLIKGSTLDYATELIGSSFRLLDNPQAKGAGCGCGVSWELKI